MDVPLFKFHIVFILCIIASANEVQSAFKDEPAVTSIADAAGVIDISSGTGRTDVQTNLNLSPWEMYVLADLVFKVIAKQCPKIRPDVLSNLKQTLSTSFKQAPIMETQNEEFLPSYSRLVRCLDLIEQKEEGTLEVNTTKEVVIEVDKDISSQEEDWTAKDAVITTEVPSWTKPLSKDTQDSTDDQVASSWLWGFRSLHKFFRNIFSSNPESPDDTAIGQQRQQEKRKEQKNRIDMAYREARQNHANFFHKLSQLLQKSCPASHLPDKLFMRRALLDMNTWMTLEPRITISGAIQWFRKEGIGKILEECHQGLQKN